MHFESFNELNSAVLRSSAPRSAASFNRIATEYQRRRKRGARALQYFAIDKEVPFLCSGIAPLP